MKKSAIVILVVLAMVMAVLAFAAEKGKPAQEKAKSEALKVGDERYVCNCGDKCPCNTISSSAGKCTCGNDMVTAKVTKVEKGKATFKAAAWDKERSFNTVAKYVCSCGPDCKCKTISQNPGKCTCGADLKKI